MSLPDLPLIPPDSAMVFSVGPARTQRRGRGRPTRFGSRQNLARSLYGTYLSWLSYLKLVRWWFRHTPPEVLDDVFMQEFYWVLGTWPGADRGEWSLKKRDSDMVMRRLARKNGLRLSSVKQLVREGRELDRAIARQHGESWTERWFVEHDSTHPSLLRICKDRLGRRQRLSRQEALKLYQDLKAVVSRMQRWFERSWKESLEARKQGRPSKPSLWVAEIIEAAARELADEIPAPKIL